MTSALRTRRSPKRYDYTPRKNEPQSELAFVFYYTQVSRLCQDGYCQFTIPHIRVSRHFALPYRRKEAICAMKENDIGQVGTGGTGLRRRPLPKAKAPTETAAETRGTTDISKKTSRRRILAKRKSTRSLAGPGMNERCEKSVARIICASWKRGRRRRPQQRQRGRRPRSCQRCRGWCCCLHRPGRP